MAARLIGLVTKTSTFRAVQAVQAEREETENRVIEEMKLSTFPTRVEEVWGVVSQEGPAGNVRHWGVLAVAEVVGRLVAQVPMAVRQVLRRLDRLGVPPVAEVALVVQEEAVEVPAMPVPMLRQALTEATVVQAAMEQADRAVTEG